MVKSLNKPHVIESHVTTVSKYLLKCHLHKLLMYQQLHLYVSTLHILKHKYREVFLKKKTLKLSVAYPALFYSQHLANSKIFKHIFPNTRLYCVKCDSIRVKMKKRGHLGELTGKFSCLEEKGKKSNHVCHLNML